MAIPNTNPDPVPDPVAPVTPTPDPVPAPAQDDTQSSAAYPPLDPPGAVSESKPESKSEPMKPDAAPISVPASAPAGDDLQKTVDEQVQETPAVPAVDPNVAIKNGSKNIVEGKTSIEPEAGGLAEEKPATSVTPDPVVIKEEDPMHKTVAADDLVQPAAEPALESVPEPKPDKGMASTAPMAPTVSAESAKVDKSVDTKTEEVEKKNSGGGIGLKMLALVLFIGIVAAAGVLVYLLVV